MVESMREHATVVSLSVDAVDTCGTGGDGAGTFNISTASALVAAGAGCAVAKHGNRAASSRCGSADVLEALGVVISLPPDGVRRCVEEAGVGFLYAPDFHPALRHVVPVRRELGIRTVFNVLGPLASPARVRHQLIGVANGRLAPMMAEVLHRLGHVHAIVFTGPNGIDELGVGGSALCFEVTRDGVREFGPGSRRCWYRGRIGRCGSRRRCRNQRGHHHRGARRGSRPASRCRAPQHRSSPRRRGPRRNPARRYRRRRRVHRQRCGSARACRARARFP